MNTEKTEVFLSADLGTFSPNADGIKDRVRVIPSLKVNAGVARYTLRILDAKGAAVKTLSGQGRAPETLAWDGLDDQGRRLPDGEYVAELVLDYLKGDHHEARTAPFIVDTTYPQATVSTEYNLFSPDGDGQRDLLPVRQATSEEALWEGDILDRSGKAVRSLYWKGKADGFSWDGRDDNGNQLPDGAFSYALKSTDAAGNSHHGHPERAVGRHAAHPGLRDRLGPGLLAQRGRPVRLRRAAPGGPGLGRDRLLAAGPGARGEGGAEELLRGRGGAADHPLGRRRRLRAAHRKAPTAPSWRWSTRRATAPRRPPTPSCWTSPPRSWPST